MSDYDNWDSYDLYTLCRMIANSKGPGWGTLDKIGQQCKGQEYKGRPCSGLHAGDISKVFHGKACKRRKRLVMYTIFKKDCDLNPVKLPRDRAKEIFERLMTLLGLDKTEKAKWLEDLFPLCTKVSPLEEAVERLETYIREAKINKDFSKVDRELEVLRQLLGVMH